MARESDFVLSELESMRLNLHDEPRYDKSFTTATIAGLKAGRAMTRTTAVALPDLAEDSDAEYDPGVEDDELSEDDEEEALIAAGEYVQDRIKHTIVRNPNPTLDVGGTAMSATNWLNSLAPEIIAFNAVRMGPRPIQPEGLAMTLEPYQCTGVAAIEHRRNTEGRMIYIADAMGLGKTYQAIAGLVASLSETRNSGMFNLLVVPNTAMRQWSREIERLYPGQFRVCLLQGSNTSAASLSEYDIVICNPTTMVTQWRLAHRYRAAVKRHRKNKGHISQIKRPMCALFPDIIEDLECKRITNLVIDEAQCIKNCESKTYHAAHHLGGQAEMVVLMSGTILANNWEDLWSPLTFAKDNPVPDFDTFANIFADVQEDGDVDDPGPQGLARLRQLLNSFVIGRGEQVIKDKLPELMIKTIGFELTSGEKTDVNTSMALYSQKMAGSIKKRGRRAAGKGKGGKKHPGAGLGDLSNARQISLHPLLAETTKFSKNNQFFSAEAMDDIPADKVRLFNEWHANASLKSLEDLHSSRTRTLVTLVYKIIDVYPGENIMIFSESTLFQALLRLIFFKTAEPIECLVFNGDTPEEKREGVLTEFLSSQGQKLLLIGRGVGGVGLNIQGASIVIITEPWWCESWEVQAIKRAHRRGANLDTPIKVYKLVATNSTVDDKFVTASQDKHDTNMMIAAGFVRADGVSPEVEYDIS